MRRQFKFNGYYFCWTIVLFIMEVLIEKYVHDRVIRPYGGDLLVVILVYCFFRSFFSWPVKTTAIGVLAIAYLVETLQYLNLIKWLGLQDQYWAAILMGNYFEWIDMFAYTLGIGIVILVELYIVPIYRNSFIASWQGIMAFFKDESNAKVHLIAAVLVLVTAYYFKVEALEWIALLGCIGLVWVTEIINTSIERIADFICPQHDERIKLIKDLAAGSVLVAAFVSVLIAAIIFFPRIITVFT